MIAASHPMNRRELRLNTEPRLAGRRNILLNMRITHPIRFHSKLLFGGLLAVSCFLTVQPVLHAAPFVAGNQQPNSGIDQGELLFGELNCVACHGADETVQVRLMSRSAPSLENAGDRLTPQFLQSYLTSPQTEKPGTTMPDALGHLSAGEKSETVEALVHYLASLGKHEDVAAVAADPFRMEQGGRLYHTVGCVTCHEPFEPAPGATTLPASLKSQSVPLGNLAHKTTVAALAKFLVDPLAVRLAGRMPSLGLSESEATAIAVYLLRDQAPGLANPSKMDRIVGLNYHYFEFQQERGAEDAGAVSDFIDRFPGNADEVRGRTRLVTSGVTEKPGVELKQREDYFGLLFSGYITVPDDGEYTFFTTSDDGSRLYIDGKLIVNNDGDHGMTERSGKVTLTKGDHAFHVTFYEIASGEGLEIRWQGPAFRKQLIPSGVFSHMGQAMRPTGAIDFVLDPNKAMKGRTLFQQNGCANCHGVPGGGPMLLAAFRLKNLDELTNADAGCLAPKPDGLAVNYDLSSEQRIALQKTVANRASLNQPLTVKQSIDHTITKLNCYACHYRDAIGGPVEDRRGYFIAIGEADLGDEGRMPPHLTGVGRKLKESWMNELLKTGAKVRPYMATRMPVFGDANVAHLPEQFAKADGGDQPDEPVSASLDDAKFGRKLIGISGVSCIACHNFGDFKSLGIPAINLADMTKRLRKEWFQQYLINPFALRPGTRMPSFWPEGHAVNTEILGGKTYDQIDAIWAFLAGDPTASPPDGLVQGTWELVADQNAVMYRHFIEGSGSRAIGVGYPEKANLSWDANDLRLALIWQGPFMDLAKQRNGRGPGYEGPLGRNAVKLPDGPPLAILANPSAPWPKETGYAADFRMRGYTLDDMMRPTLKFQFKDVMVRDYPVAKPGAVDAFFVRTLTFESAGKPANLFFRAAVGKEITRQPDGSWLIDGKVKMKFPSAPGWAMSRESEGHAELLMPVSFNNDGTAEIVQEIVW